MRKFVIGLLATVALSPTAFGQQTDSSAQPEVTYERYDKAGVEAANQMVAAANPLASQAGLDVLENGGNAIDAMVAVQFMLNLVEPQSSGIGGGAFMLYYDAESGQLHSFDGREKAPMAAGSDYFLKPDGERMKFWDAVIGGRSVGVPGTLKLLDELHDRFGSLDWAELVAPTIELAEAGFEVSPRLANSIAGAQDRDLAKFPATKAYFFNDDGSPKEAGTLLQNPEFAATLRLIAEGRSQPFYQGEIGADIVDAVAGVADNPGVMTLEDLAAYDIVEREPVCASYRGYEVCGMGPPSSGALTVGQMLGLLEHFDLPSMGPDSGRYAEAAHLFAEAGKLAYADRGLYMADSDFVRMPTKGLLDPAYLTARAQLIDIDGAAESVEAGNPPWREAALWAPDTQMERAGTSHFSIRDAAGNAVSMTTTIETGFGSRVMSGGFLLNNELTDFSFLPARDGRPIANRVEPGKRPRSSMAPTIVLDADEKPLLLIGSPGGSRIINYVAQAVIGILDWGLDPQDAINLGHFVNRGGATDLEEGTEAVALAASLEGLGHKINVRNLNSGLHAIMIGPSGLVGGADPRREGLVLGN